MVHLLISLSLSLSIAPFAMASSRYDIPAQIQYWGKKTSATNFAVGTCKENSGGDWQQLADGTWAPPGDPLNTCATGGTNANISNSLLDPWYRQGLGSNTSTGTFNQYLGQTGYNPWGANYPGNYENTDDWFTNCVLMQSLVARPECQLYPRNSYFYPVSQPWGSYSGDDSLYASYTELNGGSATHVSASGKLGDLVMGVLLGYGLNQILN